MIDSTATHCRGTPGTWLPGDGDVAAGIDERISVISRVALVRLTRYRLLNSSAFGRSRLIVQR